MKLTIDLPDDYATSIELLSEGENWRVMQVWLTAVEAAWRKRNGEVLSDVGKRCVAATIQSLVTLLVSEPPPKPSLTVVRD